MVLLYHLLVINLANCLVLRNPNCSEISAKAHFHRELILIMDTAKHLGEYFDLVPTTMTINVSAHEDNNNSSAVILAQTNPPDPEHTPNSKFFHSARWFRREEIMIRVSSCRRLILYLPYWGTIGIT